MILYNSEKSTGYNAILSSTVLSQQCCEVYFICLNSNEVVMTIGYQIMLKSPPPQPYWLDTRSLTN